MLIFDAYKNRDLQNFIAMLTQCEAEGITDIRFIRERIQQRINEQYRERRSPQQMKAKRKPKYITCPSCKKGVLVGPYNVEGLKVVRCSKKCGYSEAIG